MQQTSFKFEIIIHDDASTDGTAVIAKKYADKHPDLIYATLQIENQRSKGHVMITKILPKARGKYIALCEGDDYWVDPLKLQKQVQFLETHDKYSLCFCNVNVVYDDHSKLSHPGYSNDRMPNDYYQTLPIPKDTSDIFDLAKGNFIHSPGVVFRNWIKNDGLPDYMHYVSIGDWPLHMRTATFGKIKYFSDVMTAYRVHSGGIFSQKPIEEKLFMGLMQYPPMLKSPDVFPEEILELWRTSIPNKLLGFWDACKSSGRLNLFHKAFSEIIKEQPEILYSFIEKKDKSLENIKQSRSYRIATILSRVLNIFN